MLPIPSASSTNLVTVIDSPLSVNEPKLIAPLAVMLVAPVIAPLAILKAPSVKVLEIVTFVNEIALSNANVTWSPETVEVILEPPATTNVSPPSIELVVEPSLTVQLVLIVLYLKQID